MAAMKLIGQLLWYNFTIISDLAAEDYSLGCDK